MKKILSLLLLLPVLAMAQDKGISFDQAPNWKGIVAKAKAENKYIFVDAYATWCGPCKMLKARTFTDSQAAAFFNANFVNVSMDMEKGQGPQLARKWGLRVYPTLIIFDPKGNAVLGAEGFISANDLIRFGQWENKWGYKTDANPLHRIYPVPAMQKQLNPGLTQNPGY